MIRRKNSVFYKYFFSNLLICIISVSIMGSILYKQVEGILLNQVNDMNLNRLTQLNNQFEADLGGFLKIVSSIPGNKVFLPSYTSHEVNYSYVEVVNALKSVTLSNDLISDTMLYYPQTGKAFTSSGALSINSYNEYLCTYEGRKIAGIDSSVFDSDDISKIYFETDVAGNARFLHFIYPVPLNSSTPFAKFSFIVDYNKLQNLANSTLLNGYSGNVYIYDNYGNSLISTGNLSFSNLEVKKLLADPNNNIHNNASTYTAILGSSKYSISHMYSDKLGWNYFVVMTDKQFTSLVFRNQTFILLTLLFVLIFMTVVALFIAFSNYKPIRDLFINIKSKIPDAEATDRFNEIESIRNTVNTINESNIILAEKLDSQQRALLTYMFYLMYEGKTVNDKSCSEALVSAGINLDGRYFSIIISQLDAEENTGGQIKTTFNNLSNFLSKNLSCYGVELPYDTALVVLAIAQSREELAGGLKGLTSSLSTFIEQSHSIKPLIGIGGIYESLSMISLSLVEARIAIEGPRNGYDIIEFKSDNIKKDNSIFNFHETDLLKLKFCLKQGNVNLALVIIDEIFRYVETLSFLMAKYICHDIISIVIKTIIRLNIQVETRDISMLQQFSNYAELKELLKSATTKICTQIEKRNSSKNENLCNDLIRYIKANITDPNFSLELLAEKFSLSQSYLSIYFKEHAGATFSNYIRNIRIEKVKNLLLYSDKSIQEIVAGVGYQDVSNFIRTFRNLEGITPGDYRRLNGKQKDKMI